MSCSLWAASHAEPATTGGALHESSPSEQILADVLGWPVVTMVDHEASSRGAILQTSEALVRLPAECRPGAARAASSEPDFTVTSAIAEAFLGAAISAIA